MRHTLVRIRIVAVALAGVALLAAACGKSGGTGSGGTASAPTVATRSVSGVGTVLVDPSGKTLYYLKPESATSIQCTGSCASTWPPFDLPSGVTAATAGSGVTGKLSTATRPDGSTQVTYNGHPLYTYTGDTAAGQANGQGVQNVWFVVTPSIAGSTGSGGGGYGY